MVCVLMSFLLTWLHRVRIVCSVYFQIRKISKMEGYGCCHGYTNALGFIHFPSYLFLIPCIRRGRRMISYFRGRSAVENLASVVLMVRFQIGN